MSWLQEWDIGEGFFSKNQKVVAVILFSLSLATLFFTIADIGVTIDEPYRNRTAAKLFVGWLGVALEDILQDNWEHFYSQEVIEQYFYPPYIYHPPFARLFTGIIWSLLHNYIGELEALRLAPAILFSLNIALLFILIGKYFSSLSGIVAALALLLIPATFGHAHLIALDSPIASMWFFTVFCFIKGLEDSRWSIALGIVWGLALNTKIHAYFIPIPLFLWCFLYCRHKFQNNFFAMLFLSPIVLIISNPYLWHDTIYNWFSFISIFAKRKVLYPIPTYFLGSTYAYSAPWYYPFFMVLITLPPTLLILAFIGIIGAISRGRKVWSTTVPWQDNLSMLFLFNALAPLGLVAMSSAPTYDSVRLFLPAYPFLAGLAGVGFYYLSRLVSKAWRDKFIRIQTAVLGLMFLTPPIYSLVHIHPYELSYFNIFIGGIRGAWEAGLEITYWNDPFNPAFVRYLNEKFPGKTFRPHVDNDKNFDFYHELGLLREDITYRYDDYDYLLLAYRQGVFDAESWFYAKYIEPVYTVEIDGVPLLGIYKPLKKITWSGVKSTYTSSPESQAVLSPQPIIPLGSNLSPPGQYGGLFKVPESGWYWLGVLTNEEVEILVDKTRYLQVKAASGLSFREARVLLEKGFHMVEIKFNQAHQPILFYLGWRTSSKKLGIIPLITIRVPKILNYLY
jgi:4-amino-4-deoxy-L-arabinose transferase-like glycosyltransferase